MNIPQDRAWYDKKRFVIPLLIFLLPVGLYALYKNREWGKNTKIAVAVASSLVFIGLGTTNPGGDNVDENASQSEADEETTDNRTVEWVTPTVDELNVRVGPGPEYERAMPVPISRGDRYAALQDSVGWTQIRIEEDSGTKMWASGEYLEPYEDYRSQVEAEIQNRIDRFGKKPVPSAWDGTYIEVSVHLEKVVHNPDAVEIIACTKVYHHENGWLVGCDWRGENAFGAVRGESNWFIIRQSRVVEMHDADAFSVN